MPTSHGDELDPIIRNNNETFDVVVYDENDDPKDITNDTIIFEARLKISDAVPLIQKTSDDADEIEKVDAANGVCRVYIDPDDTQDLTKDRMLYCSLTDVDIANRQSSILFQVPVQYRA
jgi:hypothetical protein